MSATKTNAKPKTVKAPKPAPYAITGYYTDLRTKEMAYILSNGAEEHKVHRSPRNKRVWKCDCKIGQKGQYCTAMAAYFAIANKQAKERAEAEEAEVVKQRAEAVMIRNDSGPRIYRA